jgi:hypothetical protein
MCETTDALVDSESHAKGTPRFCSARRTDSGALMQFLRQMPPSAVANAAIHRKKVTAPRRGLT